MPGPDPHDDALARLLADCEDLLRRILVAGEDADAVLAELQRREEARPREVAR